MQENRQDSASGKSAWNALLQASSLLGAPEEDLHPVGFPQGWCRHAAEVGVACAGSEGMVGPRPTREAEAPCRRGALRGPLPKIHFTLESSPTLNDSGSLEIFTFLSPVEF